MIWNVIGISALRRPDECFITLQSGHLIYHSQANNGQAGVGFLINRKCKPVIIVRVKSIIPRIAELAMCITKHYKLKIVQVFIHQQHHPQKKTQIASTATSMRLYHYTKVMGYFNAQIGKRTNAM